MKKQTYVLLTLIVLSSAISFYAGSRLTIKKAPMPNPSVTDALPSNLRQGGVRQRTPGSFGGIITGKILSQNEQNIVVELRDGGSKIVFVAPGTEVTKFVEGTAADLTPSLSVSVTGDANPDGSITAKTIQLRPEILPAPGRNSETAATIK